MTHRLPPSPPTLQVKECLRLASQGIEYKPAGAAAAAAGGQQAAGGGQQAAAAAGEVGQRHEHELHEEEALAATVAEEGEGGVDADAGAALDEARLLGERVDTGGSGARRATVKRIGSGLGEEEESSEGMAQLGLFGLLLWLGALVVAFLLLPWARKSGRRGNSGAAGLASPYRSSKGRDD